MTKRDTPLGAADSGLSGAEARLPDAFPPGTRFNVAMVAASPFPYPQGSQVLIGQLAAGLQRRGHAVSLVTYHHGVGEAPDGVAIYRIPALPGIGSVPAGPSWQKPLLDPFLVRELHRVVRRQGADVMHAHNFEGLLCALVVRRLTGVPVVYHIHNAMGLELHTYFGSRLGRWAGAVVGRWVDAELPSRADYCIVLNERAVDYFRRRRVERLGVIEPGIDFEAEDSERLKEGLSHTPLVLYSGNLDRYQDLDLLLRAFQHVAEVRPEAQLVLSTNADPGEMESRAVSMGIRDQIIFSQAEDFGLVRGALAAADVAVCPRVNCLGFPIKLLNYMAAGKAIVASEGSACGVRHLDNGWVVENGDVHGMAAAILALLDDPSLARRLGASARRTARSEYNWPRAVAATEKVYANVVGWRTR
jgi:1,2-diacylglycerol 3-alpha-glucosyltransferase